MTTRGQVLLNRIQSRPIHEQAKQQQAEFDDPYSTWIGAGASLLEGYNLGKKIMDKGHILLDKKAREKRKLGGEKFKDYKEYKFYQGLSDEAKEVYDNPFRFEKGLSQPEIRGLDFGEQGINTSIVGAEYVPQDILNAFNEPNVKKYLDDRDAERQRKEEIDPVTRRKTGETDYWAVEDYVSNKTQLGGMDKSPYWAPSFQSIRNNIDFIIDMDEENASWNNANNPFMDREPETW